MGRRLCEKGVLHGHKPVTPQEVYGEILWTKTEIEDEMEWLYQLEQMMDDLEECHESKK